MATLVYNKKELGSEIESFFSMFGTVFERFFNSNDPKLNAMIILEKLKDKYVNPSKLQEFLDSLPEDRWSVKTISERQKSLAELFGISNEEIREQCISKVNEQDIAAIKWEMNVLSMLDSATFAAQYYDALKYNQNPKLSLAKMKMMNELLLVFKYLKDSSKKIYEKYEHKKYNKRLESEFHSIKFGIDLLWIRILYVLFNLNNADNAKIDKLRSILAHERISLAHQKIIMPRYN